MTSDEKRPELTDDQISAFAAETGVTSEDIRHIVKMVGAHKSSILFHARALAGDRKR